MTEATPPAAARRGLSAEFVRYLLAGLANTAVGYAAFLALLWGAGLGPRAANAGSYAVGLCLALLLNRYFVFEGATVTPGAVVRFAAGFGVAYALNLATLWRLLDLGVPPAWAQLVAMAVYTIGFYAINRLWVWRRPGRDAPARGA
ncbi:GtrA family protein [Ideonella sp. A 288]|uniref:GtrA family protein n=1 Tax=Ideonella sp. A 288 TaxID=1962181 RepID=UPI000B4B008A|nr:GtrA family protein [Ideonella sp. A 288]